MRGTHDNFVGLRDRTIVNTRKVFRKSTKSNHTCTALSEEFPGLLRARLGYPFVRPWAVIVKKTGEYVS